MSEEIGMPRSERLEPQPWSDEAVEALAERYSTWGHWGENDQMGAANHVTEATVAASARLVNRGAVFSLAMPMDNSGPQKGVNGRINPQHVMLRTGTDISTAPGGAPVFGVTDDAVYMPLQSSTQWDALCHIVYRGRAYNNRPAETITSAGAQFNSITNLRDRAVGRGILLDFPRMLGRDWLEAGESIQADDLARCAAQAGIEVGEGDFVLIRTGQLKQCRADGDWSEYAGGPAPGLGVDAANFLCPRGVVGVATDTWGIEAIPYETPRLRAPLHVVLLVHAGIYIGEMWDMEALAEDCAVDGIYEFMLVAQPLTITGSVGSPLNPLAIK
jgi:kynurenine formamidase